MKITFFIALQLILRVTGNLIDGECIGSGDFDATVDYFPDKAEIEFSKLFEVEYFPSYKIVTNTHENVTYCLYQCGSTGIDEACGDVVVEVPITSIALGDTTFITRMEQLGERLAIKGYLGATDYISSPCVNALIDEGEIVETDSCGLDANNETLAVNVSFILIDFCTDPSEDFKPVYVADLYEDSLLGQAEWLKYFALFFNKEAEATEIFNGIKERYVCTAENAEACNLVNSAPLVAWSPLWYPPFGWTNNDNSQFYYQAIEAAGGSMIVCDTGDVTSSFGGEYMTDEEFLACNAAADVCVFAQDWDQLYQESSVRDVLDALPCVQNGRVFDNQKNGQNDWFESRISNPDVLLEDLVMAIHDDSSVYGIGFHNRVWLRDVFANETVAVDGVCEDTEEAVTVLANECVNVISTDCQAGEFSEQSSSKENVGKVSLLLTFVWGVFLAVNFG